MKKPESGKPPGQGSSTTRVMLLCKRAVAYTAEHYAARSANQREVTSIQWPPWAASHAQSTNAGVAEDLLPSGLYRRFRILTGSASSRVSLRARGLGGLQTCPSHHRSGIGLPLSCSRHPHPAPKVTLFTFRC